MNTRADLTESRSCSSCLFFSPFSFPSSPLRGFNFAARIADAGIADSSCRHYARCYNRCNAYRRVAVCPVWFSFWYYGREPVTAGGNIRRFERETFRSEAKTTIPKDKVQSSSARIDARIDRYREPSRFISFNCLANSIIRLFSDR